MYSFWGQTILGVKHFEGQLSNFWVFINSHTFKNEFVRSSVPKPIHLFKERDSSFEKEGMATYF
jgi:hypothetical protein